MPPRASRDPSPARVGSASCRIGRARRSTTTARDTGCSSVTHTRAHHEGRSAMRARVADVERSGGGLLVRGRSGAGRALFPVADVDVDARGLPAGRGSGSPTRRAPLPAGRPPVPRTTARTRRRAGRRRRARRHPPARAEARDAARVTRRAQRRGPDPATRRPAQDARGSARVRQRSEHEGEGRAVPARVGAAARVSPTRSRRRMRGGRRWRRRPAVPARPGRAECRRQAMRHAHDDDGDEGGSAQEGGSRRKLPGLVGRRPARPAARGRGRTSRTSPPSRAPPTSGQARPRPEASPQDAGVCGP